jgi:Uma2 family endonuclease
MNETTPSILSDPAGTSPIPSAAATLTRPITVQQWGELDGWPRYDLVDGVLKEKPDVALWHEFLLMDLAVLLHTYVKKLGLGHIVTSNAKLKISAFGGREPDIFFVPKSLYNDVSKNVFKGVPPLVVEILSPSNEAEDRGPKRAEYAQLGVTEYWIVDFPNRVIEIHALRARADGSRDYELVDTVHGNATFRPAMFPGLEIPLPDVWPTEFENRAGE